MTSQHKQQQGKQVRRFVVLYLGIERDNFINTYLDQIPAQNRSEFIRQALYGAILNAPRQLRLPEPGQPAHAEPALPPATSPDAGSDLSEQTLISTILKGPGHDRRDRQLAQFAGADLAAGEDLVGLVKDLLWQHYTGATSPAPDPQSLDARREAALSAKLKTMSFAALMQ